VRVTGLEPALYGFSMLCVSKMNFDFPHN